NRPHLRRRGRSARSGVAREPFPASGRSAQQHPRPAGRPGGIDGPGCGPDEETIMPHLLSESGFRKLPLEQRPSRMLDRFLSALVALSLALLGWLYLRSRDQELLDNVPIPVQVSLVPGQEEHYDLDVSGPCQVPVSFLGPPARIRELRGLLQR